MDDCSNPYSTPASCRSYRSCLVVVFLNKCRMCLFIGKGVINDIHGMSPLMMFLLYHRFFPRLTSMEAIYGRLLNFRKMIDGRYTLEYDTTINGNDRVQDLVVPAALNDVDKEALMMLAKLFNWFGPGLPKVDLVLSKTAYVPGEKVTGSFHLIGGLNQQIIQRLECDLMMKRSGEKPSLLQPVTTVLMNRELDPKEESEYPFHFVLPEALDLEDAETTYLLQTTLVLKNDAKTSDTDEIHIVIR